MRALLERWAIQWADLAWTGAVASTVVALVVLAIWWPARRRLSPHLGHALFLLPLVPLALPFQALPSAISTEPLAGIVPMARVAPLSRMLEPIELAPAASEAGEQQAAILQGHDRSPGVTSSTRPPAGEATGAATSGPGSYQGLGARTWAFFAWLAVVSLLGTRFVIAQLRTARLVRRAEPLDLSDLGPGLELGELEHQVGLGRRVQLRVTDELGSPAVWGLRRPQVLVPAELVSSLEPSALRWVLLHELAHVRRADLATSALQRVLQIAWFFHPVAWITNRLIDELRECACDEAALAAIGPEAGATPGPAPRRELRRTCAAALLSIAERAAEQPARSLAVQTFFLTPSLLERRMLRILDPSRPARTGLPLFAIPPLLLGAGAALASPQIVVEETAAPAPAASSAGSMTVDPAVLAESRVALDRALGFLVESQRADGAFQAGRAPDVLESGEFGPAGLTGLAVQVLLPAAGRNPGTYGEPLARAVGYLAAAQDPETGCFASTESYTHIPNHAVATMAWIQAHAGSEDEAWQEAASKAIGYLLRTRNPYGAWRYDSPPSGDNDSFVTGLVLRALETARQSGLEVPEDDLRSGWSWIAEVQDPVSGRTGYSSRGEPISRLKGKKEAFPREESEMVTAVVLLARYARGERLIDSEEIQGGVRLVGGLTPVWSRGRGSIDYYHWAFGTAALAPHGGKAWERWRIDLFDALLSHQEDDGSWAAIDAWSSEGSDVHATVLCTLALQAAGA